MCVSGCVSVCVCVSPRRYTHLDGGSSSFFSSFSSPFSFISHHLPFYSRNGRGEEGRIKRERERREEEEKKRRMKEAPSPFLLFLLLFLLLLFFLLFFLPLSPLFLLLCSHWLPQDSWKFSEIFRDAPRCSEMLRDASRCSDGRRLQTGDSWGGFF